MLRAFRINIDLCQINRWYAVLIVTILASTTSLSQDIDTLQINTQIKKANTISLEQPKEAMIIANWVIDASRDANFLKGIIEGNTILSKIKYYQGNIEGAIDIYSHLIGLAKAQDNSYLPSLYHKRALAYFELTKHYNAIEDAYAAFSYIENPEKNMYSIRCNILLSDIYSILGNFDNAITYSKTAYALAFAQKDSIHVSYTAGILGDKFLLKEELDSVDKYLKISKRFHNSSHKSSIIVASNYHHYSSKYYLTLNDLDEALYHAKETEKLVKYIDNLIHLNAYTLGKIYFNLNDYKNATYYFEKVFKTSTKAGFNTLADANYHLSKIYYSKGQKRKAYDFLTQCNTLKDSAQQHNNNIRIAHLSSKYESEKKDNEINKQKLKINTQDTELFKKQQYNIVVTMSLLLAILVIIVILYANILKYQKRKTEQIIANEKLKTKDAFIRGEESERKQLSVELHDGINVKLSALKYHIASEEHSTAIKEDFKNSILSEIDRVVNHVRIISNNLSPSALLHFDLVETIKYYCSTLNGLTPNIHISFTFIGDSVSHNFQEDTSTTLYRIVQELLNNSIKHSQASDIMVQIAHQDHRLSITIEDNGKGFDLNDKETHGLGLKNIRSRVDYINATFDIVSDNKGTSTLLEIDLSGYAHRKIAI